MGRPRPGDFTRRRDDAQRPQTDLLRIAPRFVNRRNDAEPPPEPFLVPVPSGGLSLRAAWAVCWTWAHEAEDGRRGAAVVAFLALGDAHEAAKLPTLDENGHPSRWTLHELDALDLDDLACGVDLPPASIDPAADGVLVVTPPTHPRSTA